jgi:hypothetical protein
LAAFKVSHSSSSVKIESMFKSILNQRWRMTALHGVFAHAFRRRSALSVPRLLNPWLRVSILVVLCWMPASVLSADETTDQQPESAVGNDQAPHAVDPEATSERTPATTGESPNELQERKRKKALAGFLMLGLVCIIFLFFVLTVTVVSSRFRKEVTQPLSKSTPADPLWYLKHPKPTSEEPGGDELTN